MKAFSFICLIFVELLLCEPSGAQSYLMAGSIKGDATASQFKDQIDVIGYGFSITNLPSGAPQMGTLVVQKYIDRSTPILSQFAASGQTIDPVVLTLTRPEKGESRAFYIVTLNNCRVMGIQTSLSIDRINGQQTNVEFVAFSYTQIQWQFGTTRAAWNVAQNKPADSPHNPAPQDNASPAASTAPSAGSSDASGGLSVRGVRADSTHFSLSFNAIAGKTYRILGSGSVNGPFSCLETCPAAETKEATLTVPAAAPMQFFRVEENP